MAIIVLLLSALSIAALLRGIVVYRRTAGEPFMEFTLLLWTGLGLVPALTAVAMVVVNFAGLDAVTWLVGLAAGLILTVAMLSVAWAISRGWL